MHRLTRHCLTIGVALVSAGALASPPCHLSVSADDPIIWPGEDKKIDIWAHFPLDGYAFASADFDVKAGIPQWLFASDGFILGNEVLGAAASQQHDLFNGNYADPSNPYRIWTGIFRPDSYEPRLIDIKAIPADFWYYPSEHTSSAVQCDAATGRKRLFINPVAVGPALVAPAEGTTVRHGFEHDYFIAGDVRADEVEFGFLFDNNDTFGVRPIGDIDGMTIEFVGLEDNDAATDDMSMTLNFEEFRPSRDFAYNLLPCASEVSIWDYQIWRANGEVERFQFDDEDPAARLIALDRLPATYTSRIEFDQPNNRTHIVVGVRFYFPAQASVGGHPVEDVRTIKLRACINDLRPLRLSGEHHVEASGGGLNVALGDGSVRFIRSTIE